MKWERINSFTYAYKNFVLAVDYEDYSAQVLIWTLFYNGTKIKEVRGWDYLGRKPFTEAEEFIKEYGVEYDLSEYISSLEV